VRPDALGLGSDGSRMLARTLYDTPPGDSTEVITKTGETLEAVNATGRTIDAGRFVAVSNDHPHRITHEVER
jgi:hypothetical protein